MERELARSRSFLALEETRNRALPPQEPIASAEEHRRRFDARLHVSVRSIARDRPALEAALRAEGISVHEIAPIAATLEDLFIEAVSKAEAA
jgi:hypothetical protein